MLGIFNRINVNTATIYSALMQKAKNEALSQKTLNKLVRVANTDVGISIRDAQRLFKENKPIATNIHTQKLVFQLKRVAGEINNPSLSAKVEIGSKIVLVQLHITIPYLSLTDWRVVLEIPFTNR